MFGKKKITSSVIKATTPIQTIPVDFYAGANPVIKFKVVEREVDTSKDVPLLTPRDKVALDKATVVGKDVALHPVHLVKNPKKLLIAGGILFVLFIAGASWYYWRIGHQTNVILVTTAPPAPLPPAPTTRPPVPSAPLPSVAPTSSSPGSSSTIALVPSLNEAPLNFPSRLLSDSVDSDNDGLTDAEEELFGTDPQNPDSDHDGYTDAHEVYNLYDPTHKTPAKLIDSGLIKEFANPGFGYHVYYPTTWAVGNVDPEFRDILFSTITGEHVEIRAFDKGTNYSFGDWFAKWAPGEKSDELLSFSSVFKQDGLRRSDYLVYYFEDMRHVYAMLYHTTDSTTVNYRTVIKMMARSWRFAGVSDQLPSQLQLFPNGNPLEPASNTTSSISSSSSSSIAATSSPKSSSTSTTSSAPL